VLLGAEIGARVTAAAASTPPRPGRDTFPQLTERDLDILEGIARGVDNTSIARELGFVPKTIRNLVSELFSKLGAADRGDAARIARDAGLGDTRPR
jgi:DNA-binding NarL/FixJ family response regulator